MQVYQQKYVLQIAWKYNLCKCGLKLLALKKNVFWERDEGHFQNVTLLPGLIGNVERFWFIFMFVIEHFQAFLKLEGTFRVVKYNSLVSVTRSGMGIITGSIIRFCPTSETFLWPISWHGDCALCNKIIVTLHLTNIVIMYCMHQTTSRNVTYTKQYIN